MELGITAPPAKQELKDNFITVNGFSKTFAMTGWRLGYAAGSEEIISALTKFNMYNAVCANSIAQYAGLAALKAPSTFFEPILRKYSRLRNIMCECLDDLGLPYVKPQGAFYTFPEISSVTKDSLTCCYRFLQKNMLQQFLALPLGSQVKLILDFPTRPTRMTCE